MGYNPVSFFSPNTSYTAKKEFNREGDELKALICELNANGIEVILDVVFNHTAEGNENGPFFSFKGFDNRIYYMLTPEGMYYNFSGCGNTLNCNHPVVQQLILECLRYWTIEYHVDGFRFDLASILGRNEDGSPASQPPLLKNLAEDPILRNVKLIAEAWDAGGLYQVGSFPAFSRWAEWNGKYRDDMRSFFERRFLVCESSGKQTDRFAGSLFRTVPGICFLQLTFLPVMMAFHSGTSIPIMENTMKTMGGTIRTDMMIIGAGTAERREKRKIRRFADFVLK